MGILNSLSIDEIRARGSIRDGDVVRLAQAFAASEAVSEADAKALLDLHAACPIQDPAWSPFFVGAIADFVVQQAPPEGYVVAENARWLIARIARFGRIETSTELTLLVHVIENARWTPPSLAAFGLAQIRHAIETGTGPLRAGRIPAPGTITPEETELARRLLHTFSAEPGVCVTRVEADEMIAINRAIGAGQSTPDWTGLFVRMLAAAVLSALGHGVPSRRDLLDGSTASSGGAGLFALLGGRAERRGGSRFGATTTGEPALSIWSSARILSSEERALGRLARQRLEIVTNEVIEEADEGWLVGRLGESERPDGNEAALLNYIVAEASQLPPEIASLAARAAIAA